MNLGIVGATGLVGKAILTSLEMLNIYPKELYLFGSHRSESQKLEFNKKIYGVIPFELKYLKNLNYCILAVDNSIAKDIINYIYSNNLMCVVIDNSSEFRLFKHVPLVIPEINSDSIQTYSSNIISNPNCTTTFLVMLLGSLSKLCSTDHISVKRINVATYQAASGAGIKGLEELIDQTNAISNNTSIPTNFWGKQYAFNVFSHNSKVDKTLYNQEELKMINETKKILSNNPIIDYDVVISPTCVRVPTIRSHCLDVELEFNQEVDESKIMYALKSTDYIVIENDCSKNEFPEPLKTSGSVKLHVGRIRPVISYYDTETEKCYYDYKRWKFFISGDQILKGAAYNSVQILKYILDTSFYDTYFNCCCDYCCDGDGSDVDVNVNACV